jgi:hypothetical protein
MSELKVNKISANDDSTSIEISSKIGIGTTTPPGILSIDGSALTGIPGIHLTGFSDSELDIAVEDGEALQIGEWNSSTDTATLNMIIKNNGKVGIGESDPDSTLSIKQAANSNAGGIRLIESASDQYWAIYNGNNNLQFKWDGGANGGYLDDGSNENNITFTGQHRTFPGIGTIDDFDDNVGLIIVSTGDYYNLPARDEVPGTSPTINESLPKVVLSTVPNQKSVFGVISNLEDKNGPRIHSAGAWVTTLEKPEGDERLIVNSLGEGAIWVSNINGDLENGDYITTCEIPGYGMKQDDDMLHNYTVAKITQDCTFDLEAENYTCEEIEHDGQTYKRAFVGCTYHCG